MKALSLPKAIAFYLESRRRLGFALEEQTGLLQNLVKYAQQLRHRGPLSIELALNWAQVPTPAHSLSRARRLGAVRRFAIFWAAFDPRTQIPPSGLFGPTVRRSPIHIYTPANLAALLTAAQQLTPSKSLRATTFHTLLGLLACTGLRISEALRLHLQDWEPQQAVLTIHRSKFGRSRCVPLSASSTQALESYLQRRSQAFPRSKDPSFFLNEQARPLAYEEVRATFTQLRRQLGWQHQQPRPRLHDLRHTFAVHCLIRCYREGQEELNAKILNLAVYLGHRDIRHTYWYLTGTPELLALGSARWAKALARHKGVTHE